MDVVMEIRSNEMFVSYIILCYTKPSLWIQLMCGVE